MEYFLNFGIFNNVFILPNLIADKYLNLINFEQLKVLLWLLRHAGENFSQKNIAKALNLNEQTVFDSINFWQNVDFLNNDVKIIIKNELLPNKATAESNEPVQVSNSFILDANHDSLQKSTNEKKKIAKIISSNSQLKWNLLDESSSNIINFDLSVQSDKNILNKRLKQSPEILLLVQKIELIFEKKISVDEKFSLLNLFEKQKLSSEAIVMLIQYLAKINKKNVKYAEKIATTWFGDGINSVEKIKEKIKNLNKFDSLWCEFTNIVGIDRKIPYANEREAITRWFNEWKFSKDMIVEAFNRCFAANKKYILKYMDSIIKRWKNQGVLTLNQALEETKFFTMNSKRIKQNNQFANKPSYDLEAYEKYSIFN